MELKDQPLSGRKILVCVTASISAYKSVYLVRNLTSLGAFVSVALTPSSKRFVGSETFSALSSEPTYDDLWDQRGAIAHTTLPKACDAIVVYPATATTIAKMAAGIGDDMVSAALLATPKEVPIFVAPAMHEEMFENPSTTRNLEILDSHGVKIIGPEVGELAGGEIGKGRLISDDVVIAELIKTLDKQPLKNEKIDELVFNTKTQNDVRPKILVTAGGTREKIDPVRFITNASSGKMGHAIAQAANLMGYEVFLITASSNPSGKEIHRIDVETSDQMHEEIMKLLGQIDVVVMCAAVSDFKPENPSSVKLKRDKNISSLKLVPTIDILKSIVENKNIGTYVVGFAAESENLLENASNKFANKKVDMLIANDISNEKSSFGSDTNKIWIFTAEEEQPIEFELAPKLALAYEILELIGHNRARKESIL